MQTAIRFTGIFKIYDIVRIPEFNKKTSREIWEKNWFFCQHITVDNKKLNHSVCFWKDVEVGALNGDVSGGGPRSGL